MSIGTQIKKIRKEREITQGQLAEYLNVSPQAVSHWECDRSAPDIMQIPLLCRVLNVTSDELLCIDIQQKEAEIQKKRDDIVKTYHDSHKFKEAYLAYMSPCSFVAQLTDTHCRYLAATYDTKDGKEFCTFLDGDVFMDNWGFGEDNCGSEINLSPKGDIQHNENTITTKDKAYLFDMIGRYNITINNKTYDTVCVMEIYNNGVVSEQYLDKNGRTILWRRFNKDDWAIGRYKKKWSEMFPNNEQLIINGGIYVHWYDCITDYIL